MIDSYADMAYSYFFNHSIVNPYFYKAARVPWVSLLYFIQMAVGPFILMPLMICVSWVLLGFLYFLLVRNLFGSFRALYILPWLVFFPHLVGSSSGGGLYNNCAAMSYFLIGLLIWIYRSDILEKKSDIFKCVVIGILVSSSVFTNIIYINLLLIFPLTDFLKKRKTPLSNYLGVLTGLLISTVFWGAVNSHYGRPFRFMKYMVGQTWTFVSSPESISPWWHPVQEVFTSGLYESYLLIMLTSLYLVALLRWIQKFAVTRVWRQDVLTAHYIFIFSLWIFWQWFGVTSLSPTDFLYPLELPAFLMVASWLETRELKKEDLMRVAAVTLMLWSFSLISLFIRKSFIVVEIGFLWLYFLFIGSLIFIFFVNGERKLKYGYYILMAFLFALLSIDSHMQLKENCTYREDSYRSVNQVITSLAAIDEPKRFVFFADMTQQFDVTGRCLYRGTFRPAEVARVANVIIGSHIADLGKTAGELTDEDFYNLSFLKDPKLVLFQNENPEFASKVLSRISDHGFGLDKIFSSSVKILDHDIYYDVYQIKQEE
jgi:hypothetical protein